MQKLKQTLILFRFHFSILLMPVFLFAISQTTKPIWWQTILGFFILHLLVYPSSNAFNSYYDRDKGSIGGLKNPPAITSWVYPLTIIFDSLAIVLSALISIQFALMVIGYIIASRAYSAKNIRLKKNPLLSYLVVFIFQGGYTYIMSQMAAGDLHLVSGFYGLQAASFLIGGVYPLTQIYQHREDAERGDITISMKLGLKGTFRLSTVMFILAAIFLYMHFASNYKLFHFYLYLLFSAPSAAYLLWWMKNTNRSPQYADFTFTMIMSTLSAVSMNIYFTILLFLNH
ncbi:MAG: UbiA family prenyltransferase [Bacteroidia bacterium]|jgi:1,4-dihydroxy-2-naphthoate octaprenyltransferase|nr:UbiA family prenyltransferase [Bacteroidia bacterium]